MNYIKEFRTHTRSVGLEFKSSYDKITKLHLSKLLASNWYNIWAR